MLAPSPSQLDWPPHGLVSLWDMIAIYLPGLIQDFQTLKKEQEGAEAEARKEPTKYVPDYTRTYLKGFADRLASNLRGLELGPVAARADRLVWRCDSALYTYGQLASDLNVIEEVLADETRSAHLFHIPKQKAAIQDSCKRDWAKTYKSFPSARDEIWEAVSCYTSGHDTACVFHLMRVAEHGLRALARERQLSLSKPLEWNTWQDLISRLETEAKAIGNRTAGPERDKALEFYRGAVAHFHAFKDQYRNSVMHARVSYDEHEAMSIMVKVRNFMEPLSVKLQEEMEGQIDWGFKPSDPAKPSSGSLPS